MKEKLFATTILLVVLSATSGLAGAWFFTRYRGNEYRIYTVDLKAIITEKKKSLMDQYKKMPEEETAMAIEKELGEFLKTLDGVLTSYDTKGSVLIVKDAVVAGEVIDITKEIGRAVGVNFYQPVASSMQCGDPEGRNPKIIPKAGEKMPAITNPGWGNPQKCFGTCLSVIVIGLYISVATAIAGSSQWWMKNEQGWFFYKDPPLEEQETLPEAKLPPPNLEEATPVLPFIERMRKKGDELLGNAMEKPTEANMLAYMRHNKAMLDTSNTFAQIWQRMLMKYPELFLDVSTQKTKEETEKSIRDIRNDARLIFVYNESCPFSEREAPVLTEFRNKYGFNVLPVTMDGGIFPEFPDTRLDNGISTTLGVKTVPAIFIAFPDQGKIDLLSSSFISLIDLESKIYRYLVSEDLLKDLPEEERVKRGNEKEQRIAGGN